MGNPKLRKILLIDDDGFLLDMYEQKYREVGCAVVAFSDADGDIVQRVLDVHPDVIVLDIIMPGRIGWDALTLLKEDARTKDIPVFMASNQAQKEDIEKSLKLGAVDHLVISYFTPSDIPKLVLDYLNNPKTYRQVAWTQTPYASRISTAIKSFFDLFRKKNKHPLSRSDTKQLFVLKTRGVIAADGTFTLDTNGLGKALPTQRNRDIVEAVRQRYVGSDGKLSKENSEKFLAEFKKGGEDSIGLPVFFGDPRNPNIFYTTQEDATFMARVGDFYNHLDEEYRKEKMT